MDLNLADKVAVVTGANKGIGLAITKALVAEGAYVNSFFQPDAATIDYGVAKAAVVNLSKSLSQELGPKGIRVNCVSPGQVGTDLWLGEHGVAATIADASGVDADTIRETAASAIATGRFTTPEEVANLVVMLASERTANVTGATTWWTAAWSRRPENICSLETDSGSGSGGG